LDDPGVVYVAKTRVLHANAKRGIGRYFEAPSYFYDKFV